MSKLNRFCETMLIITVSVITSGISAFFFIKLFKYWGIM